MMNRLSQEVVPSRLSTADLAPFEERYKSADDVTAQLSDIVDKAIPATDAVLKQVKEVLRSAKISGSTIAHEAHRLGAQHLLTIFNAIANAGLHVFAPDVFGNAESMYNLVHEHLAIHTFRAVATAFGYLTVTPITMSLLDDYNLLRSFYRSYTYGYMRDQARKEDQTPGRVVREIKNNNANRRHKDVCFIPPIICCWLMCC